MRRDEQGSEGIRGNLHLHERRVGAAIGKGGDAASVVRVCTRVVQRRRLIGGCAPRRPRSAEITAEIAVEIVRGLGPMMRPGEGALPAFHGLRRPSTDLRFLDPILLEGGAPPERRVPKQSEAKRSTRKESEGSGRTRKDSKGIRRKLTWRSGSRATATPSPPLGAACTAARRGRMARGPPARRRRALISVRPTGAQRESEAIGGNQQLTSSSNKRSRSLSSSPSWAPSAPRASPPAGSAAAPLTPPPRPSRASEAATAPRRCCANRCHALTCESHAPRAPARRAWIRKDSEGIRRTQKGSEGLRRDQEESGRERKESKGTST